MKQACYDIFTVKWSSMWERAHLRVQGALSYLLWYWYLCGTIMCVVLACVWYWQRAGMRFGRMRAIMQKCAAVSPPTPTTSTSPTPTQVPHLPLGREAPTQIPSSFPFSSIQPVCKWWGRSINLKSQRHGAEMCSQCVSHFFHFPPISSSHFPPPLCQIFSSLSFWRLWAGRLPNH